MASKHVRKYGTMGTVLGLAGGVVLTILSPPIGTAFWFAVLGGAGAGAAVGGGVGLLSGSIADEIRTILRDRVIQIFGPPSAGKNSVHGTINDDNVIPNPTSIGTNTRYGNSEQTPLKILSETEEASDRFIDIREVAGEDVETWKEVIIETNPHCIIYVVDSFTTTTETDPERQFKLKEEVNGIKVIEGALREILDRRINVFMILLNKIDKTSDNFMTITEQYRSTLFEQKVNNITTENLLRSVLGKDTPIRVHPFCAQTEKRSNYNKINQEAISRLVKDLHTRPR